jgi:hypothetical protein
MTVKLSTGARNALAGATGFGATFEAGVLFVYSGPQPLSADNAPSGTLLGIVTRDGGTFAFGSPENGLSFGTPASGTVAKKAADNWKFSGIARGTAGWFRLMGNASDGLGQSATAPRMDGSVGVSGADLNLSNIAVEVGAPHTIDVFQFTIPAQ